MSKITKYSKILEIFITVLYVSIIGGISFFNGAVLASNTTPKNPKVENPEYVINAKLDSKPEIYGFVLEESGIYTNQIDGFNNAVETINTNTYDFLNYPAEWSIATYKLNESIGMETLGFTINSDRDKHKINVATTDYADNPIDGNTVLHTTVHEMIHTMYPPNVMTAKDFDEQNRNSPEIICGTLLKFNKDDINYKSSLFEEISVHLLENKLLTSEGSFTQESFSQDGYGETVVEFVDGLSELNKGEKIDVNNLAMIMGVASMDKENAIYRFSELFKKGVEVNGKNYSGYDVDSAMVESYTLDFIKTHLEFAS